MKKNEFKKDPTYQELNKQKAKAEIGDMILFFDKEIGYQEKGVVEERVKHPNSVWMYMVKPEGEKGIVRLLVLQDEIIEVLKSKENKI